ncbi:hypothetical protein GQ53DRAFT_796379 [Thozetella sp. PMI_491]|nr:hypothetical protein GQ53DRAFT_796379 [Thozetella sp. PMI_491]
MLISQAIQRKLHFSRNSLSRTVYYSRRCIKPVWSSGADRNVVSKIANPLVKGSTLVNLSSCADVKLPPCETLELRVPYPYPRQAYADIIFGVASNYDRLQDRHSLDGFAHWLSGTEAKLVAIVMDVGDSPQETARLATLRSLYESRGINLEPIAPRNKALSVAHNHFAILGEMLQVATEDTRWFGLVDDDTFFPSLYRLDQELQKHDHTKPAWLGALSEDFAVVKWLGIMAYGGAGTFLSLPLARKLVPHIPDCLKLPWAMAHNTTGDGLLRDCIFEYTRTKLSIVEGLYQHDLRGDLSGFFESGVQPLSVHHWRSWYKVPMPAIAAVSRICGDCFLQRWQFGERMLLANGYSITEYAKGVNSIDLQQMEGTWSNPGNEFEFSLGPLRPALEDTEKKSYRLIDASFTAAGGLRQLYVYRDPLEERPNHALELIWDTHKGFVH